MRTNRVLALLLALVFTLGVCSPAFAETATGVTVTASDANSTADQGKVILVIGNSNEAPIELESVQCTSNQVLGTSGAIVSAEKTIQPSDDARLLVTFSVLRSASGAVTENLRLTFTDSTTKTVSVDVSIPDETVVTNSNITTNKNIIRLASYDQNGLYVPAPSGNYGEACQVRLPIMSAYGAISNITVTPVLSTSLDEFPFNIDNVDYTLSYPGYLSQGQVMEFQYNNLILSKKVTAGVKKVDFTVNYYSSATMEYETATLSVYVNVIKGSSEGTSSDLSTPKVILDSYTISSEKIYAGETFDITFALRNTSSSEAVQNIQVKISDTAEVGKLIPANGGSNTLYINKIGKGEVHQETISFQSAPDTEAKAYTLSLELSYEGANNATAYTATETIAVPILQKIRVKVDDPVVYDEPFVGDSCAMYVALYNMGKSSLYNCIVDVEGDGLAMEETYFGGTVTAGSTMRADFSVIPSTAGQIDGFIVITYEDVYGEQMEERLPLSLYVNDYADQPMEDAMMDYPIEVETQAGFPWGWVILGVVLLGAGAVVLIILLKKKRTKELADI